jgi:hypothetical protein
LEVLSKGRGLMLKIMKWKEITGGKVTKQNFSRRMTKKEKISRTV